MDSEIPNRDRNLVFTDLEFTHLDPTVGEIISIACKVVKPNTCKVLGSGQWHMHPRWPQVAESEALAVNGYTDTFWDERGVTTHTKALKQYLEMARDGILVAHNVTADWSYLETEIRRQGMEWTGHYHKLDTLSMFWPLYLRNHDMTGVGLWNLCEHYGISNEGAHDAMVDVERMVQVYGILMGQEAPNGKT